MEEDLAAAWEEGCRGRIIFERAGDEAVGIFQGMQRG